VSRLRAALALYFAYYNFCRIHSTIRCTLAMEAELQVTFGLFAICYSFSGFSAIISRTVLLSSRIVCICDLVLCRILIPLIPK
jgi:hypothetical protein